MNRLLESHEPSPEFRAHLEWQIETALRRESRLASPVGTRRAHLRAAFIVVVALIAGGAAGVASGRVQDARQRNQLIETAQSEADLARVRLELAQAAYQDARRRFEVGTTGRDSLTTAETEMRAMETTLARIQLDMQEIRLTSAVPRNDLDAPLVGTRDFVRERLALQMTSAQGLLTLAEQTLSQVQQRFDAGMSAPAAILQAQAELAAARARMQLLSATLDLRRRYLNGEMTRDALAPALRRTELTVQIERAQRELDIAGHRVGELRRMVAVGQALELDLKRAEVDLLERQLEIKRIQQELAMVGAVKR